MTDLREKIESSVRTYRNHHPKVAEDAILDLLRESVKPLEWEHVSGNVYDAMFAGCLYRKIGLADGSWVLRIDTTRYDTMTAETEDAVDEYARENVAAQIFSAMGLDQ